MRMAALGDVARIERAGVSPSDLDPSTLYLGLEHIERGGRIIGHNTVGGAAIASTKFVFTADHVLFGKLRPNLGKVARPSFAGVCSTDILPIRPGENLDRDYLARFLSQPAMVTFAASRASGANLPRLSPSALAAFEIPLPTIEEQRRIAAILDKASEMQEKRRQIILHLDALEQSIFNEMFGDIRSNEKGWTTATVEDVAERVTDGEHQTPRRCESGVPLLSARNIRDGWINFEDTDFIDDDEFAALSRRIAPRSGDILVSCSGSIGRVAQVRDRSRFALVRSVALVRPSSSIDPTFLQQVLSSRTLKATMISQANSSAQANLFQNQIRRLPVFVPPFNLQREFSHRIENIGINRVAMQRTTAVTDDLFASLSSRAFRGEL